MVATETAGGRLGVGSCHREVRGGEEPLTNPNANCSLTNVFMNVYTHPHAHKHTLGNEVKWAIYSLNQIRQTLK